MYTNIIYPEVVKEDKIRIHICYNKNTLAKEELCKVLVLKTLIDMDYIDSVNYYTDDTLNRKASMYIMSYYLRCYEKIDDVLLLSINDITEKVLKYFCLYAGKFVEQHNILSKDNPILPHVPFIEDNTYFEQYEVTPGRWKVRKVKTK